MTGPTGRGGPTGPTGPGHEDEAAKSLIVRDKRRIDPATGRLRLQPGEGKERAATPPSSAPAAQTPDIQTPDAETPDAQTPAAQTPDAPETAADAPAAPADPHLTQLVRLRQELAERTADLQRVKAEYDNYRKRVQRDRLAVREIAVINVLTGFLPVLDAIAQAREHEEMSDGFRSVATSLESHLAAVGLQSFGEAGEPFDPALHEALTHTYSDEVERATCTVILQPGYRVGEHLLRPARVAVAEPPAGPPAEPGAQESG